VAAAGEKNLEFDEARAGRSLLIDPLSFAGVPEAPDSALDFREEVHPEAALFVGSDQLIS
jgi:hypothetical protein